MFNFLFGLSTTVKIALIGLLIVGGLQVRNYFVVRNLNNQVSALSNQLDQEKILNHDLQMGIEKQNAAISNLRNQAKRVSAEATTNAVRVVQSGAKESASLRSPQTSIVGGPEAMNKWLTDKFKVGN